MFQLKALHTDSITTAIAKAERYRFLNDASAAESICRDILQVDPENQQVLVMLILSLTDQFGDFGRAGIEQVRELVPRLKQEYQRCYYSGILCERWAKARLNSPHMGSSHVVYEWLRDAMTWFEKAEAIRPAGNDEALLRWNSCVRSIAQHKLEARDDHEHAPSFGE